MQTWMRMAGSLIGLSLPILILTNSLVGAADDDLIIVPKNIQEAVNKMADTIAKGEKVDKPADLFYKDHKDELKQTMWIFKPRDTGGKGGFGVGSKPGVYIPDGIEGLIISQGNPRRKAMTKEALKDAASDLNRLADVTLAIAELTYQYTPKKKQPGINPKGWTTATDEMKQSAQNLKTAIKANKPEDVKKAFTRLYASCNNCHAVFLGGPPVKEVFIVPKEIRDVVNTMADAVAKGEKIDKPADKFFNDHKGEQKQAMWVFKLRPKDDEGSFSADFKLAGRYPPDSMGGIIVMQGQGPANALTQTRLKADAEELNRLADVVLAMAEVTQRYKPKSIIIGGPRIITPKEWMDSVDDMKQGARDLKAAIKANNPDDAKKAFRMLNTSCNNCHATFGH